MDKYFGARIGYILTVYLVLCATISQEGTSLGVIFGTLVLFLLPFVFEYYNMVAVTKWGIRLRGIGFWCSLFAFIIMGASMLYTLFMNLDHTMHNKTIYVLFFTVQINFLQYAFAFWLLLGLLDWIVYSTPEEKAMRKEIRENQRKTVDIKFRDRIAHYESYKIER